MVAVKKQNDFLLRSFLLTSRNVPDLYYSCNVNCKSQLPIQLTLLSETTDLRQRMTFTLFNLCLKDMSDFLENK